MLNKKGQAVSALVVLVLAITGAAFMFHFTGRVAQAERAWTASSLCETSASAKAATKVAGAELPIPIIKELNCRTKYYAVTNAGIIRSKGPRNQGAETVVSFDKDKKDEAEKQIKRLFAEEMRICWRDLGAGTLDPFGAYTQGSRCVPCAEVYFDTGVLEQFLGKDELTRFADYLEATLLPSTEGQDKEVSYFTYLREGAKGTDEPAFKSLETLGISIKKHYSIVYRSARLITQSPHSLYTLVTETTNIPKYCQQMY